MYSSRRTRGSIFGQVVGVGSKPVPNAAVMITGQSPTHRDIAALTNEFGEYELDNLVPGLYTLLVNATEFVPQTQQVRVEPGGRVRLNIALAPNLI